MPDYGNFPSSPGYLYPAGTLDGMNGVNADGTVQFPAQVIGEWLHRRWRVGVPSAHARSQARHSRS